MEQMNKKNERRTWTREETLAFLNAYLVRKEEFTDARKKKYAMQNVLLDLEAQGVLLHPTTVDMLASKLKNLLRAWRASIDNNKRTGAAPSVAPFGSILDEIFGKGPTVANAHTMDLHGDPISVPLVFELQGENTMQPQSSKETQSAKEKLEAMRLKTKLQIAERRNEVFRDFTNKKLQKMEEAEANKQQRHEEKMSLLREFLNKK